MLIRVVLAANEGKILVNGDKREHMVYIDGVDELPDISMWQEVEDTEGAE